MFDVTEKFNQSSRFHPLLRSHSVQNFNHENHKNPFHGTYTHVYPPPSFHFIQRGPASGALTTNEAQLLPRQDFHPTTFYYVRKSDERGAGLRVSTQGKKQYLHSADV